MVEERFTFLAVVTHGIMLAIVTHSAAHTTRGLVHRRVKVTARRVTIALASCHTVTTSYVTIRCPVDERLKHRQ